MALGSTYNNNQNQKQDNGVTIYSGYRMNNAESKIDATCLTFRFWRTNLCVSIFPRKQTGNDEVVFDTDNGITIYLTHTKARILKHEMELFLKDPITYNSVGVPAGQSVITISNGAEYGKNNPVLTIRKLAEGGEVSSSFAYEFKKDYHYSIRNYDGANFNTVYEDYQDLEIRQMIDVLDQYCIAMTHANAFSVCEQMSYRMNRMGANIEAIATSLGVELKGSYSGNANGRRFNSDTHFRDNNAGAKSSSVSSGVSYSSASIDDLDIY